MHKIKRFVAKRKHFMLQILQTQIFCIFWTFNFEIFSGFIAMNSHQVLYIFMEK